jgi:hypothetical protein
MIFFVSHYLLCPRVVPGPAAAAAKISSEGTQATITLCLPGLGRTTSIAARVRFLSTKPSLYQILPFISSSYSMIPFLANNFFSYITPILLFIHSLYFIAQLTLRIAFSSCFCFFLVITLALVTVGKVGRLAFLMLFFIL